LNFGENYLRLKITFNFELNSKNAINLIQTLFI